MAKSRNAMGLMAIATIVLAVLKSKAIIDWPWIWVLCPVWIYFLVANILIVAYIIKETKK